MNNIATIEIEWHFKYLSIWSVQIIHFIIKQIKRRCVRITSIIFLNRELVTVAINHIHTDIALRRRCTQLMTTTNSSRSPCVMETASPKRNEYGPHTSNFSIKMHLTIENSNVFCLVLVGSSCNCNVTTYGAYGQAQRESRYIIFDLRTLLFGQCVLCDNATMTCQKWREENFEKEFRPQVWVAVLSWERARSEKWTLEANMSCLFVYDVNSAYCSTIFVWNIMLQNIILYKSRTHTDALVCVSIRMAFELRMQNNK